MLAFLHVINTCPPPEPFIHEWERRKRASREGQAEGNASGLEGLPASLETQRTHQGQAKSASEPKSKGP